MPQCHPEGLTTAEAEARLSVYGPNKLPESKRNPVLQYLGYMWNPLSWAMEAAAIIAIALLDFADFALILALLILNATISFVEESSAVRPLLAPCPLGKPCASSLPSSWADAMSFRLCRTCRTEHEQGENAFVISHGVTTCEGMCSVTVASMWGRQVIFRTAWNVRTACALPCCRTRPFRRWLHIV